MARQPRAPRTPYKTTTQRQPHGPQRPPSRPSAAAGAGSRAFGMAKGGGNMALEAIYGIVDFIAKLLRRMFGKVMSSDLEKKREDKRNEVKQEQGEIDRLKAEKSDLERDLSREKSDDGEPGRSAPSASRKYHSELLQAADELRESGGAAKQTEQPARGGSAPALGNQMGSNALPAGAAAGAQAFLSRDASDWQKGLEALASGELSAGDLTRHDVLQDLHAGNPYSHESLERAFEKVRAIQESGAVERGDNAMFELLTCTGYIEAATENARIKMEGPQEASLVAGEVEERVSQIMTDVSGRGGSASDWTSALGSRATHSVREAEKALAGSGAKTAEREASGQLGHDGDNHEGEGGKPSGGRRPGLPGPGSGSPGF